MVFTLVQWCSKSKINLKNTDNIYMESESSKHEKQQISKYLNTLMTAKRDKMKSLMLKMILFTNKRNWDDK